MIRMRLIDVDKLRKAIPAEEDNITGMGMTYDEMEAYNDGIDEQWKEIINAPTIDAAEVVRKPVKGYEGYYEVDQFGRVFSIDREVIVNDNGRIYKKPIKGKRLKQSVHTHGYKTVPLTKNGKTKTVYVHRIVAEAFIDNPNNLPYINHKDEDKTYNFVENLEWCTASYNNTYNGKNVKHSKKIKGRPLTEEHKRKISNSLKRYYGERGEQE